MKAIRIQTSKINPAIMDAVLKLSRTDLEKLVLLAAQKNKDFHDFLLVNYAENEGGEKELFEEAKADLETLFRKRYKGFSEELQLANMLAACHKRINEFGKICNKKDLELELILYVLNIPFSLTTNMFCTCFTQYNYRVVLLVKRAVTLLKNKLHEDYRIEFEPTINNYLTILHSTSSHLDFVNVLPKSI
jgi:hypothetical protein